MLGFSETKVENLDTPAAPIAARSLPKKKKKKESKKRKADFDQDSSDDKKAYKQKEILPISKKV